MTCFPECYAQMEACTRSFQRSIYSDLKQDELILICFLRPDSVVNLLMGAIGTVLGVVGLVQLRWERG